MLLLITQFFACISLLLLEYLTVKEMRILLSFVLMCCMSGLASAQMTAAKKIPPAIEKKIVLKASAQKVWDYISEPANYKKFSGVKEFTCEEKALNAKIELTGKDGKKRSQYISVIDYDVFKICYLLSDRITRAINSGFMLLKFIPKETKNVRSCCLFTMV